MGPQRLDRGELRRRLADQAEAWVVDELADVFETAFLTARRQADEAARKRRKSAEAAKPAPRRPRQGRPQTDGEPA